MLRNFLILLSYLILLHFIFFFVGYNLHVFSATFARKYTVALGVIIVYILQNLGPNLGLILPFS